MKRMAQERLEGPWSAALNCLEPLWDADTAGANQPVSVSESARERI